MVAADCIVFLFDVGTERQMISWFVVEMDESESRLSSPPTAAADVSSFDAKADVTEDSLFVAAAAAILSAAAAAVRSLCNVVG